MFKSQRVKYLEMEVVFGTKIEMILDKCNIS